MRIKRSALKYWLKYYYDYNLYCFKEYFEEIDKNSSLSETDNYFQHGCTTRYLHSVAVAYYSYKLAMFLGMKSNMSDLVRGALAHDYFLYNTKEFNPELKFHGLTHPKVALENAEKDFDLSDIEKDIIYNHMFPLTTRLPKYKETFIVTLIDKACAVYEAFKRKNPYPVVSHSILGRESYKFDEIPAIVPAIAKID